MVALPSMYQAETLLPLPFARARSLAALPLKRGENETFPLNQPFPMPA
jgi:hypothetical protein